MRETQDTKVVVMGLGYVGLPTAALMASKGLSVVGVDVNADVVEIIKRGEIHIVEPDLQGLVRYGVERGYLTASTTAGRADTFIVAVPTPFKENHEPDISYVECAIKMIIPFLERGNRIIIESTSPVGTTEKMRRLINAEKPLLIDGVYIAYCPERVLPGRVIYEIEHNDRIVGGVNDESADKIADFYARFVKGQIYRTGARTAEMCKLMENAYRDVNIGFANELSMVCEKAGVDFSELICLANRHPRVNILNPGPGVGGHCISVDPWFVIHDFPDDARLIRMARDVNRTKTEWVIEKICDLVESFREKNDREPVVACMGLTYKPDIDDLRESPSLFIIKELIRRKLDVLAVEPNIESHADFLLTSYTEAVDVADILVYLVAHREFKKKDMKDRIVLDFCGLEI